jgi:hypothetical protein
MSGYPELNRAPNEAQSSVPHYIDGNGNAVPWPFPLRTSGSLPVGGAVTYTDRTVTSATGASQTLVAANPGRKNLILKNGAGIAGVNILNGTAAIGGAGTLTFQPYEALALSGDECPTGAINLIAAAGAYFTAIEGT